jgi:hypothetical protein
LALRPLYLTVETMDQDEIEFREAYVTVAVASLLKLHADPQFAATAAANLSKNAKLLSGPDPAEYDPNLFTDEARFDADKMKLPDHYVRK